jgi:hypothetical protein
MYMYIANNGTKKLDEYRSIIVMRNLTSLQLHVALKEMSQGSMGILNRPV